jgi:hypothetical protein
MAFFKGNDVVLNERLTAIRNEFELALLKQRQEFERELEEMETALLNRIEQGEKSSRSDSLKADEKKPVEGEQVTNGYTPWSQRKARRVIAGADPEFPQKVLRRSQRAKPA